MVTAGAVAAGAYLAAGDAPRYAAASLSGQAGSGQPGGTSAESAVAALRSRGWACPDLASMGFHVASATTRTYAGQPAVELRLSNGRHTATVLEQHTTAGGDAGQQGAAPDSAVPVNPLTGHAASEDGFVALDGSLVAGAGAGNGRLWVKPSAPWSAIYQTARSTFTYVSDLPANVADDALAVLSAAEGAWARSGGNQAGVSAAADSRSSAGSAGSEQVTERLQRGLRKIALELDNMTGRSDR